MENLEEETKKITSAMVQISEITQQANERNLYFT